MKTTFKARLNIHLNRELKAAKIARERTGKNAAIWWDGYHQALETLLQDKFN